MDCTACDGWVLGMWFAAAGVAGGLVSNVMFWRRAHRILRHADKTSAQGVKMARDSTELVRVWSLKYMEMREAFHDVLGELEAEQLQQQTGLDDARCQEILELRYREGS